MAAYLETCCLVLQQMGVCGPGSCCSARFALEGIRKLNASPGCLCLAMADRADRASDRLIGAWNSEHRIHVSPLVCLYVFHKTLPVAGRQSWDSEHRIHVSPMWCLYIIHKTLPAASRQGRQSRSLGSRCWPLSLASSCAWQKVQGCRGLVS